MAGKPDTVDTNGSAEKDREDARSTDSESEEDRQNETENKTNKVMNVQPMDRKPKFDFASLKSNSSLMNKLPGFLAEMDAANRELEAEKKAGTIAERRLEIDDDEEEGEKAEQYIEMNLGLGVLEEKTSDSETSSEGESSDDEDVMDKLMGAEKDSKDEGEKKKVGIEEV
ncbi:hypothetical protein VC83_07675 [Pseudogymnoascus destructans]|uniref:Uncharacterized protein n=2 Tax=Pseudogymnoascus destructans TaxID=655981 RepID=L8FXC1_PSED2|nr:uncharacterized protein VC83_07675 [Pseudogymnoascus destructans]ELR05600.1 hypothetical protein GMDG_01791 [Pseudogymnoascus destructans 20631-21]OAF55645.1 hypothetical protein VC83_07675 [Pseudogymnoascus destructans]